MPECRLCKTGRFYSLEERCLDIKTLLQQNLASSKKVHLEKVTLDFIQDQSNEFCFLQIKDFTCQRKIKTEFFLSKNLVREKMGLAPLETKCNEIFCKQEKSEEIQQMIKALIELKSMPKIWDSSFAKRLIDFKTIQEYNDDILRFKQFYLYFQFNLI